jgi:protein ImuB
VPNSDSTSQQRIVSLWLKRISTDRLTRQRPPDPRPLVVAGRRGNADVLVAVDAAAERLGLRTQLPLAEARAMYPDLAVVAEDQAADARLLESIADGCRRYTPLVAFDAPDGILLDIAGCAHLFGGEAALVDDLVARVNGFGFTVRAGTAGTIGAAWAVARYGENTFIALGGERACLLPLPLKALRLPAETVAALRRLGFKYIGDIIDMPRAPLAARIGSDVLRQIDRALSREREALMPRLPVPPYVAEQRFPEPIAREEDVLAVVERLARRLALMLERRGEGLRHIELELYRTDGKVVRIAAGTSQAIRDARQVRALFAERLAAFADPIDPGFGFDLARLNVMCAEANPSQQVSLGDSHDETELASLIDRLSARLGTRRVMRLLAQDSHSPELAAVTVPAQAQVPDDGWGDFRHFRETVDLNPRPLRLLPRPESIETVASVPDGPPLRFRWRSALHEVAAAEGPERIEGVWWSEEGGASKKNLARDYFHVEDGDGRRFWIFRAGLYRDMALGAPAPTWFLHGLFG